MKAYIFDLDGTLIDSYGGILDSLMEVLKHYRIERSREEVYGFILKKSVHELIETIAADFSLDVGEVSSFYSTERKKTMMDVSLMDDALITLKGLSKSSMNFIFTHKGNATHDILRSLGIEEYFRDVITAEDGFPMKPDPKAIFHILDKYKIDKKDACYIGDRPLDLKCAENAGIAGVLYKKEDSPVSVSTEYEIQSLKELLSMKF